LYSLVTAGVIGQIGQDCHEQRLSDCPCINPGISIDDEGNTILQGCGSNYEWALNYLISFLESAYQDLTSLGAQVDVHNIRAGAKVTVL